MPKPDEYVQIPVSEDVRDRARQTKSDGETWNDWVEKRIDAAVPAGFSEAEQEEIRRLVREEIESYTR